MEIGVLALQGAFQEHCAVLSKLGIKSREVRLPDQLNGLAGLILPGGESTTFANLAVSYGLVEPLRRMAAVKPLWGTCAGLVFMAREVGMDQVVLGVMDISLERNAFGRQVDSFEEDLEINGIEEGPFHAVFIRAPVVTAVGPNVEILSKERTGRIVAVRQGHLLGTSFHPELTQDYRLHEYFVGIASENKER